MAFGISESFTLNPFRVLGFFDHSVTRLAVGANRIDPPVGGSFLIDTLYNSD
ncbi:hypothetical protein [Rhodohalobacter halophilus]|uniref:hypothetical protein n=1 Tax=Rhodohalobacter halophilus TaxID=1812810 RepID=UPI00159F26C6|nr:hypothetical protein [Rhodohalobacter halophilus]